jgi:hypothetical protein
VTGYSTYPEHTPESAIELGYTQDSYRNYR